MSDPYICEHQATCPECLRARAEHIDVRRQMRSAEVMLAQLGAEVDAARAGLALTVSAWLRAYAERMSGSSPTSQGYIALQAAASLWDEEHAEAAAWAAARIPVKP